MKKKRGTTLRADVAADARAHRRRELLVVLRDVDKKLRRGESYEIWKADVDDPGTPYEMWTGKFYVLDARGEKVGTAGVIGIPANDAEEGRTIARMRNAVAELARLGFEE